MKASLHVEEVESLTNPELHRQGLLDEALGMAEVGQSHGEDQGVEREVDNTHDTIRLPYLNADVDPK